MKKAKKDKTYFIYTTSQCYTTYEIEAENEEQAEELFSNGEGNPIGEEFHDEEIEEITEFTK